MTRKERQKLNGRGKSVSGTREETRESRFLPKTNKSKKDSEKK